MLKDKTKHD